MNIKLSYMFILTFIIPGFTLNESNSSPSYSHIEYYETLRLERDIISWAMVKDYLSVMGSVSSFMSFLTDLEHNSLLLDKLGSIENNIEQIKKQLNQIESKIDQIYQQNERVFAALDNMPAMVRKENLRAHLKERESNFRSYRNNYFAFGESYRKTFMPGSNNWENISKDLTFLFQNEDRVSKTFDLVQNAQFTLIASNNEGYKVVNKLVVERHNEFLNLEKKVYSQFEKLANSLKEDLTSSRYIRAHNFDEYLNSLGDAEIYMVSERTKTIRKARTTRVKKYKKCWRGNARSGDWCYNCCYDWVNKTEYYYETEPDKYFNSQRKIFRRDYKHALNEIKKTLATYSFLRDSRRILYEFLHITDPDHYKGHPENRYLY